MCGLMSSAQPRTVLGHDCSAQNLSLHNAAALVRPARSCSSSSQPAESCWSRKRTAAPQSGSWRQYFLQAWLDGSSCAHCRQGATSAGFWWAASTRHWPLLGPERVVGSALLDNRMHGSHLQAAHLKGFISRRKTVHTRRCSASCCALSLLPSLSAQMTISSSVKPSACVQMQECVSSLHTDACLALAAELKRSSKVKGGSSKDRQGSWCKQPSRLKNANALL